MTSKPVYLAYRARFFFLCLSLLRALAPPSLRVWILLPLSSFSPEYEPESERSLPLMKAVPRPSSSPCFFPIDDDNLVRPRLLPDLVGPAAAADRMSMPFFAAHRFSRSICFRFWLGPPPTKRFTADRLKSINTFLFSSSSEDFTAVATAALASPVLFSGRLVRMDSRAISFSSLSRFLSARSASCCFLTFFQRKQH